MFYKAKKKRIAEPALVLIQGMIIGKELAKEPKTA